MHWLGVQVDGDAACVSFLGYSAVPIGWSIDTPTRAVKAWHSSVLYCNFVSALRDGQIGMEERTNTEYILVISTRKG